MKQMRSKFKGYCGKCHFTIWINELIVFEKIAYHVDCVTAIKDDTPRVIDKRYLSILGKINQKKLKQALSK